MPAEVFQPLHASDLADAVKRAADGGRQPVYNVCGSAEVPAKRPYELVCRQEGLSGRDVRWEAPACTTLADSSRIQKELGWSDFRDLEGGKLPYKQIPAGVRQLVENLFLFALFFAINCLCASHSLFSHINWMMVYVILVSISYNLYQSTLAAVLASAAFLYSQGLDLLALNTFYSYADSVLVVMEFVFLGLMVSYTANMLREDARSARLDLEMLKEEYADLTAVNEENVLIKNEYEERLLTSKTGFPKLYSLISRLMVQEPDRILLKTISLLLRDSMEKALQYEELSREEHYVEGTDILKPEAFRKRVLLAREKAEKCMAEYCVAELVYSGPMADAATAAGRTLRVTDCLGTDGKGKLFALLNNTGPGNLEGLQKRLRDCA